MGTSCACGTCVIVLDPAQLDCPDCVSLMDPFPKSLGMPENKVDELGFELTREDLKVCHPCKTVWIIDRL